MLSQLQESLGKDYVVLHELSGAGMSRVFVARETQLDREVVVKVLPPDMTAGLKIDRFKREIQLAARLQHPHIVPLLSAGSHNGLLYYTMPYVHGPSLRSRLDEDNPLPLGEAVAILRDVADALTFAHSEGVIHRDVKPQNILIQAHHAVVLDFGVAKALSEAVDDASLTSTGMALGTPMYMAPEQAMADRNIDGRADIYSLGVVAYEVLTGRPPFSANSARALMAAHVTSVPRRLRESASGTPTDLEEIIMRCLEKDPDDRWQSAEELCEALSDVVAQHPVRRLTPKVSHSVVASRRPTRRMKQAAVIGLLGFLSLGGYFYRASRAEPKATAQSLLILPFTNDGGKEVDYFAHGMTQEVITSLIKVDGLKVSSATSSFTLAADNADPLKIGARAGVEFVLLGTIRRSGREIRMTTQLLNVNTRRYTWSNSYRGDLDEVFEVQSDISSDIAKQLTDKIVLRSGQTLANQRPTAISAYDLYLKGNFVADSDFSVAGLSRAIKYYNDALAIEPGYARAYSGIATAYYNLADDFWEPRKAYPLVRENAIRALKLDPKLADAYASLASYEISYGWNWQAAKENVEQAVKLNPSNSFSRIMLGWYYLISKRESDAIREAQAAIALDPFSPVTGASALALYRNAGRTDLAVGEARRMLQLAVGDTAQLRALMSWDYMIAGRLDSARIQLDSAVGQREDCCLRTQALFLAHSNEKSEARRKLRQWIAKKRSSGNYFRVDWIAEVEAAIGDTASMFDHLQQAYRDRSVGVPLFGHNPEFRPYVSDPRFTQIAAMAGILRSPQR